MINFIEQIKTELETNSIGDNLKIVGTSMLLLSCTILLMILQIIILASKYILAMSKEASHFLYVIGKIIVDTITKVSKKYVWKRTNKLGPNSTVGPINGQYENSQLENAMKTPVDIEAIRKRGF